MSMFPASRGLRLLADSWLSECGWASRPQHSSIARANRLGRPVSRDSDVGSLRPARARRVSCRLMPSRCSGVDVGIGAAAYVEVFGALYHWNVQGLASIGSNAPDASATTWAPPRRKRSGRTLPSFKPASKHEPAERMTRRAPAEQTMELPARIATAAWPPGLFCAKKLPNAQRQLGRKGNSFW